MIAAASFSSASWISSRLSKRIRSLPKPANHPRVRSTFQRCLPSRSLLSTLRLAMRLAIPPLSQVRMATLVVIALVGVQHCWSFAGAPSQACNRRNRVHAPLEHLGVMPVCAADEDNQGDASGIYNDVPLGAELASVRGVWTRFLGPRGLAPRSHPCWPGSNRFGQVHASGSAWLGATAPRRQWGSWWCIAKWEHWPRHLMRARLGWRLSNNLTIHSK